MKILFTEHAWDDYLEWQRVDPKMVRRINELIRAAGRNPSSGIGKPEPLKFSLGGCWSRRIDSEHRLVYKIDRETLIVIQCRYHY
ncbi:Txe/YoeB family addiction module toxin [bacterium]|nr:Txe/YoeB family addiction module toxin [bacterium]